MMGMLVIGSTRRRRRPRLRRTAALPCSVLLFAAPPGTVGGRWPFRRVAPAADVGFSGAGGNFGGACGQVVRPTPPTGATSTTERPGAGTVGRHPELWKRDGDPKNIPTYLVQAAVASEVLAKLGMVLDPTVVIAIVNLIVLEMWDEANEELKTRALFPGAFKNRKMYSFMTDNFLLHRDPDRFKPRQVLLHGFSHKDLDHFASNIFGLVATGPLVRRYMSDWSLFPYAYFYVFSIYMSSLFDSLVYGPLMKDDEPRAKRFLFFRFVVPRVSLGASGALSAIMTFCGLAYPNEKIVMGPTSEADQKKSERSLAEPMWYIATTAFLSDILLPMTKEGKRSNIGHGAHIGGSLFGASVFVVNRLWGMKLREFVHKSSAFLMKLIPTRVVRNIKKARNICRGIATGFSSLCRRVNREVRKLPLKEISVIALVGLLLVMEEDESIKEIINDLMEE
ncbi:hypothetical protein ACHAWF_011854 [Thalassiosira exigua]